MHSSNLYLRKCQELQALGVSPTLEPGMRVARGFADLGYEEFWLVSKDTVVSIFTGKLSQVRAEERAHLFPVPNIDCLLSTVFTNGFRISRLELVDQREWYVVLEGEDEGGTSYSSRELEVALVESLLAAIGKQRKDKAANICG